MSPSRLHPRFHNTEFRPLPWPQWPAHSCGLSGQPTAGLLRADLSYVGAHTLSSRQVTHEWTEGATYSEF